MEASEHAQKVDGKYVTQVAIGDSFTTNKASLAYILADKDICKDRKIWINKDLAKHGDLQFLLNLHLMFLHLF